VEAVSGAATRREGIFTAANDRALRDKLVGKLKAGERDAALRDAVAYVSDTLSRSVKVAGAPRTVNDEAKLFSEAAKEKANKEIAEIKRRYRKDLLIETLARPKGGAAAKLSKDERAKFFTRFADERARAARVDGIYALISVEPRYVEVVSGEATRRKGIFTDENDLALAKKLIAKLSAGQPDEALLDGVAYVSQTLSRTARPGETPKGDTPADRPKP
jgi:hypothetical protein